MNRFSRAKSLRRLRSILTAGGAVGVLLSAFSCAPKVDPDANAKALTQLDEDWSKAAATRNNFEVRKRWLRLGFELIDLCFSNVAPLEPDLSVQIS